MMPEQVDRFAEDRVFVGSILEAFGYSLTSGREPQGTSNSIAESLGSRESLMQALSGTMLTVGSVLDPPHIVEIIVTNRYSRWTVTADGSTWTIAKKRERGRPRRTASEVHEIREAYEKNHVAARLLWEELRQCYKGLYRSKKRRWETRRTAGERYLLRCSPECLSKDLAPAGKDEAAALTWKGVRLPQIRWIDFLAGTFPARQLALVCTGWRWEIEPATVSNLLKRKKKVRQ